jgi:hypothetical protein
MGAFPVPADGDPIAPETPAAVTITVDGVVVEGVLGQTLAGVLLSSGQLAWRRTSFGDRPRGMFCGIGICFDCLVIVNGQRDVRACQRRAVEGDSVVVHRDLPVRSRTSESHDLP